MANQLYQGGRDYFARAAINWVADDIRCILIDTSQYGFNAGHPFLSSIPAGARLATVALPSKSTDGAGTCRAGNPTATAVAAGRTLSALVIYKHTGNEGNSVLIAYIDGGTNLPVTTNGGDITIQWNASGIFKL